MNCPLSYLSTSLYLHSTTALLSLPTHSSIVLFEEWINLQNCNDFFISLNCGLNFFWGSQKGSSHHCMCLVLLLLESLWVADPLYPASSWWLILFLFAVDYISVTYYLLQVWSLSALCISPLLSNWVLVVSGWAHSSWLLHFLVLPCQMNQWIWIATLLASATACVINSFWPICLLAIFLYLNTVFEYYSESS